MRCMLAVSGRPIQFVDATPDGCKDACDSCGRALFASTVASTCLGVMSTGSHVWVVEQPARADEILSSLVQEDRP